MTSAAPALTDNPDFTDRYDPLLVKELRQGLRNRWFVSSFVFVHVFVAIEIGLETLVVGVSPKNRATDWETYQWGAEILFVCLLLPARALSAAGEEEEASAMDLLRLANYDASAMVYGKWKTQLLLATLLLVSLAPYHFVRYYIGGADVLGQALALAWCGMESAMLSALGLFLSTLRVWARCVWAVALVFPLGLTLVPGALVLFEPARIDLLVPLVVWIVVWFGATMFFLTLAISGFDTMMRHRHHAD